MEHPHLEAMGTSGEGTYGEGDTAPSPVERSWSACETRTPEPVPVTALTPMVPKKLARETAGDQFVPTYDHIIAPLHFCDPDIPFEPPMPPGWGKHMHPDGNLYYHNHDLQLITDVNVSDHAMLLNVLQAFTMFSQRMENLPMEKVAPELRAYPTAEGWHCGTGHWELFLERNPKNPGEFRYYVADWKEECLFWVEDVPVKPLTTSALELDSAAAYEHLRVMLRWQFWRHAEYFPAHRPLPRGSYRLLRAVLLYSANDRMTSVESTVSYPAQELRQYLKMLPERQNDEPECAPYITAMVARHWVEIWDSRMHNLYGQPAARLSRSQSRFFEPEQRDAVKLITKIICWTLLFNQPKTFYHKLCDMWVDKTVYIDQWRSLLRAMQEEWTTTGFMATVILATNMSFLGIDKLDSVDLPLVAQTASVVSTILSIGSIMSGMLLIRRHRELDAEICTAEEASDYMTACAYYRNGLLGAASLFSAPRALFLWSLLLFVSALLSFSFCRSSKIFSPFIAFTTATILLIILVQLWYFSTELTKSKSSTWTIPAKYSRPSGKPPMLKDKDALRAWPVEPETPSRRSSSTTTVGENSYGVSGPVSPWRRVRRRFTPGRSTTFPMSDVEYGHSNLPQFYRHDFGDAEPAVYASPEGIELQPLAEIQRPPVSRRWSTGISTLYTEPGPDGGGPQITWDGNGPLQHIYQLQVSIPGADVPDVWQQDTRGVHRTDTYG